MYHQIKLLAPQRSDKKCNILPVFYVLTKFDYTDPFCRISEIQKVLILFFM